MRHRTGIKVIPTCGSFEWALHHPDRTVLEVQPFRKVWINGLHPAYDFTPERGIEVSITVKR